MSRRLENGEFFHADSLRRPPLLGARIADPLSQLCVSRLCSSLHRFGDQAVKRRPVYAKLRREIQTEDPFQHIKERRAHRGIVVRLRAIPDMPGTEFL